MSNIEKPSYEELERRFQSYCKHDGGRVYDGTAHGICAICGWDTAKCCYQRCKTDPPQRLKIDPGVNLLL